MTVARSVADVLAEHVTLEVECIDRMYLNVYVPKLQFVERGGVVLAAASGSPVRVVGVDGADQPGVRR